MNKARRCIGARASGTPRGLRHCRCSCHIQLVASSVHCHPCLLSVAAGCPAQPPQCCNACKPETTQPPCVAATPACAAAVFVFSSSETLLPPPGPPCSRQIDVSQHTTGRQRDQPMMPCAAQSRLPLAWLSAAACSTLPATTPRTPEVVSDSTTQQQRLMKQAQKVRADTPQAHWHAVASAARST